MKITHIIWLEEVVEKIARKHHLSQDEVKEVLTSSTHFRFVEKGHRPGEDVYLAFGQTDAGRFVTVFFVYQKNNRALVISAREMTNLERKKHGQK